MFDQMAYEHSADLRREAMAYRRVSQGRAASRADRARPAATARTASWLRLALHRPAAPAGCQA